MPLTSVSSKAKKSLALFWSCELNWDSRSYTFDPLEDENSGHKLMLNVICLGEKNNDDVNIVEIIPPPDEHGKERRSVPIAMLKPSVLPMANISGMELTPPITFYLRCGSGPVHISGRELTVTLERSWEGKKGNEEDSEKDTEDDAEKDTEDDAEKDTEDDAEKDTEDDAEKDTEDDAEKDTEDDDDDSSSSSSNDSNERSLEEIIPPKSAKRQASYSQTSVAKKKKLEEEQRVPYLRSPEMKAKGKEERIAPRK